MRKILLPVLSVLGLAISIVACKKSNDTPPPNLFTSFTAKVNGNAFKADTFSKQGVIMYDTAGGREVMVVGGTQMIKLPNDTFYTPESIVLYMNNFNGIHDYNLADTGAYYAEYNLGGRIFRSRSGILKITSSSIDYIRGYFNFSTDSVNVTEGSFIVPVQPY